MNNYCKSFTFRHEDSLALGRNIAIKINYEITKYVLYVSTLPDPIVVD